MRAHLDLLGRLYVVWGALGLVAGAALLVLAGGAAAASGRLLAGAIILTGAALLPLAGGALALWAGRAVGNRRRGGRTGALLLAVPNLFLLPFGTALAIYTFWVLLNDHVRGMFGAGGATR